MSHKCADCGEECFCDFNKRTCWHPCDPTIRLSYLMGRIKGRPTATPGYEYVFTKDKGGLFPVGSAIGSATHTAIGDSEKIGKVG